jgi:hypothetical protein
MSSANSTTPLPEKVLAEAVQHPAATSSSLTEGKGKPDTVLSTTPSALTDSSASPTNATTNSVATTAATTGNPEAAPRKTRLLKDVEAEENRYLYETLYKSLDDATDTSIRDELTVGDTVRYAREAKQEFLNATSLPIKEKMKGCAALVRNLAEEQNRKVAYVFVVYSVLILTLPLFMLMLGLHVLAPWWQVDATYCGGGLSVGTALVLVVSYVVYAVREDIAEFKRKVAQEAEEKKKK